MKFIHFYFFNMPIKNSELCIFDYMPTYFGYIGSNKMIIKMKKNDEFTDIFILYLLRHIRGYSEKTIIFTKSKDLG